MSLTAKNLASVTITSEDLASSYSSDASQRPLPTPRAVQPVETPTPSLEARFMALKASIATKKAKLNEKEELLEQQLLAMAGEEAVLDEQIAKADAAEQGHPRSRPRTRVKKEKAKKHKDKRQCQGQRRSTFTCRDDKQPKTSPKETTRNRSPHSRPRHVKKEPEERTCQRSPTSRPRQQSREPQQRSTSRPCASERREQKRTQRRSPHSRPRQTMREPMRQRSSSRPLNS